MHVATEYPSSKHLCGAAVRGLVVAVHVSNDGLQSAVERVQVEHDEALVVEARHGEAVLVVLVQEEQLLHDGLAGHGHGRVAARHATVDERTHQQAKFESGGAAHGLVHCNVQMACVNVVHSNNVTTVHGDVGLVGKGNTGPLGSVLWQDPLDVTLAKVLAQHAARVLEHQVVLVLLDKLDVVQVGALLRVRVAVLE